MADASRFRCPDCDWSCSPQSEDREEIVRCAVEFEKHLVAVHDLSFRSTNQQADAWMERALAMARSKRDDER